MTLPTFIGDFINMADSGTAMGWHERNGGNLSYRCTETDIATAREITIKGGEWIPAGIDVPGLAGEYFLITGSGKYFSNIKSDPVRNIGLIQTDGSNYRILWGLEGGATPTSELPTHLMNHEVKKRVSGGSHRVIYHAHTPNIIALTFVLPLDGAVFTRELWEMATECPVVFPGGVGVVEWKVPGGREIAEATSRLMERHDVAVWAHHGMFVSGATLDETFGLMHTVEKAAEILVKVLSMGGKRQTITAAQFDELAEAFGVGLTDF